MVCGSALPVFTKSDGDRFDAKGRAMAITITNGIEPLMWIDGDQVMIPTKEDQRAACLKALSDALTLLADTAQASAICAKAVEKGEDLRRNQPHLSDCLEGDDCVRPSTPQGDNRGGSLRLVTSAGMLMEKGRHDP